MIATATQVEVKPKRIQRKRTKGWTMPEGAIYVGRPTKWGNPFRVGDPNLGGTIDFVPINQVSLDLVLIAYERWAKKYHTDLSALRGKDLACWCRLDQPCHADILLELANQ